MNVVIYTLPKINFLTDYFTFNQLPFQKVDLWDTTIDQFGRHSIPDDLLSGENQLLVLDFAVVNELIDWPESYTKLVKFLQQNYILSSRDGDFNFELWNTDQEKFKQLDKSIPKNSLKILLDFVPSDHYWLCKTPNVSVVSYPNFTSLLKLMPRIPMSVTDKSAAQKDFLMTTIKKKKRPHRTVLWREFNNRSGLLEKGIVVYQPLSSSRIGQQPPESNGWADYYPSMDLYLNSWVEVVPETIYKEGYYLTEKTTKPFLTRTPFLALSTCYYLQHLQNLGFKTFSSLISEDYDRQHRVEDRARLLADTLEEIIKNGSKSFYQASVPILDHNYQRLAELTGSWQHSMDSFITHCLNDF
jgi:hypothetical protein